MTWKNSKKHTQKHKPNKSTKFFLTRRLLTTGIITPPTTTRTQSTDRTAQGRQYHEIIILIVTHIIKGRLRRRLLCIFLKLVPVGNNERVPVVHVDNDLLEGSAEVIRGACEKKSSCCQNPWPLALTSRWRCAPYPSTKSADMNHVSVSMKSSPSGTRMFSG